MTKIKQIEHFQTCIHRFSLLMPIGDFHHHHTLYIVQGSNHLNTSSSTAKQEEKGLVHVLQGHQAQHMLDATEQVAWFMSIAEFKTLGRFVPGYCFTTMNNIISGILQISLRHWSVHSPPWWNRAVLLLNLPAGGSIRRRTLWYKHQWCAVVFSGGRLWWLY